MSIFTDKHIINKTMDRNDLDREDCVKVIQDLNELMKYLKSRGLKYSSWGGFIDKEESFEGRLNRGVNYKAHPLSFDDNYIPWFLYWEIAWIYLHSGVKKGDTVLDMGGCSSLFSYYLAHKGCKVYSIDLQKELVDNANLVAKTMGWEMTAEHKNMLAMDYNSNFFDFIFSICVFEHILFSDRLKIMQKIKDILKPEGKFCITFDFKNPDKAMIINSPQDVRKNFIEPGLLQVIGNDSFYDNQKRYLFHPWFINTRTIVEHIKRKNLPVKALFQRNIANYTFGALFCKRS